jgi:hypothetical protein
LPCAGGERESFTVQEQPKLARKEREQQRARAAECDAGRFGKFPSEIARLQGLSFEATALAMRQCIRVGWYGLTQQATAGAFKPGKPRRLVKFHNEAEEHHRYRLEDIETLPTGMGRDVYRRARRELTAKDIWECRRQGKKGWSKARMLIERKEGHYRRVEGAWFDADTFGNKELAVVGYVRASHGVSPADIDKRFGCSRPTTNKIVKGLLKGGWLRNDGTDTRPIYRWAKDPVPSKNSGGTGRKFPVLTSIKISGRKLSVSPSRRESNPQGAKRHADPVSIAGIDRGEGTRRATPPTKARAESAKKRPPGEVAAAIEALCQAGVARKLIDKAHLWSIDVVDLMKRLKAAITDHEKTGDPIRNVDSFFAVMVDNEIGPRCKLGAGTTVPNKKLAATVGPPRQSVFFPSSRAVKRAGRHAPSEMVNTVLKKFLGGGGHTKYRSARQTAKGIEGGMHGPSLNWHRGAAIIIPG